MCYLIAKKFGSVGSLALQTSHGQHLVDFKRKIMSEVGTDEIQLVTIVDHQHMESMNLISLWIQSKSLNRK